MANWLHAKVDMAPPTFVLRHDSASTRSFLASWRGEIHYVGIGEGSLTDLQKKLGNCGERHNSQQRLCILLW